ncbi:MAG: toll/interleukin-1 receptor domain-containing protein [Proteobacteria bacterium]|nr:toll/interleukin-1 receptor domain-containing protein [Pseudomonadota bacterium]
MAVEAIFIGYRRDDTADVAGRVHDAFAARFGKRRVFMDVDNLRPGTDFGQYIKTVLPRCRVALILIGPKWLAALDERGTRRLDDPNDWVRIEVETALATPGLDVVPVLVNGAVMPGTEELPESMRPLLRRHAAIIRRNPDFHDDVARLIAAMRASVRSGVLDLSNVGGNASVSSASTSRKPFHRTPIFIGIALAAVLMVATVGADVSHWLARSPAEVAEPAGRWAGYLSNSGCHHQLGAEYDQPTLPDIPVALELHDDGTIHGLAGEIGRWRRNGEQYELDMLGEYQTNRFIEGIYTLSGVQGELRGGRTGYRPATAVEGPLQESLDRCSLLLRRAQ